MWTGQPSKDFLLLEERLASEENSEKRREEYATPSTGRMAQNPATAPTHQTWSDENFVKSVDGTGSAFKYLAEKFPWLSEAKIKEGGGVEPSDPQAFQTRYVQQPSSGWREKSLGHISSGVNFLGNMKAENYEELIEDILSSYHKLGCSMSLKMHMLHSHLDFFPDSCGMFSDEHVELFIRKLQRRRKDIRESGPLPCWLTAVGRCSWAATQATGKTKLKVEVDFYRYVSDVHIS